MKKIAFRLNSDKAVEYANAHRETNYGDYGRLSGDWETWFHIPAFKSFDGLRHQNHYLDFPAPGYTDVTENFERDYWGPWKDKLASVRQDSIVPCVTPVDSGNTDKDFIDDAVSAYYHLTSEKLRSKDLGTIEEKNLKSILEKCKKYFTTNP